MPRVGWMRSIGVIALTLGWHCAYAWAVIALAHGLLADMQLQRRQRIVIVGKPHA